jgi:hypothetical protein
VSHRAYWTSPHEWVDPDCVECDGEGAPCCEPPDEPMPERFVAELLRADDAARKLRRELWKLLGRPDGVGLDIELLDAVADLKYPSGRPPPIEPPAEFQVVAERRPWL